jgi:hypothetical protein
MNDQIRILDDNDVIHTGASALMFQCTFKVSEFLTMMQSKLEEEQIFSGGIDCELLSPNQPWQQGKFRLRLEFVGADEMTGSQGAIPSTGYNAIGKSPEMLPPPLRRQQRVGMWS